MKQLGLNTTCVVGHGGGGSEDKGMNVNQQKRVLDDIKQFKYQASFCYIDVSLFNTCQECFFFFCKPELF